MPLSAQTIVTRACEAAECPGFTTQALDYLNRFQETLAQNYDFPSSAYTFTNFIIGPNAGNGVGTSTSPGTNWYLLQLPASSSLYTNLATFLRVESAFYSVSGQIFYLMPIDNVDYDKLFQGGGLQNYPYAYDIDMTGAPNVATPQMAFYNPPNTQLSLTIRCQYQPVDITATNWATEIPWFPNQDILIGGTAERLARFATHDFDLANEINMWLYGNPQKNDPGEISRYLKMVQGAEGLAQRVKLDRRVFRNPQLLPATKTTVWAWLLVGFFGALTCNGLVEYIGGLFV